MIIFPWQPVFCYYWCVFRPSSRSSVFTGWCGAPRRTARGKRCVCCSWFQEYIGQTTAEQWSVFGETTRYILRYVAMVTHAAVWSKCLSTSTTLCPTVWFFSRVSMMRYFSGNFKSSCFCPNLRSKLVFLHILRQSGCKYSLLWCPQTTACFHQFIFVLYFSVFTRSV